MSSDVSSAGLRETEPSPVVHSRFPAPAGVSDQARAYLDGMPPFAELDRPELDDVDGWKLFVAAMDTQVQQMIEPRLPPEGELVRGEVDAAGVRTFTLRPAALTDEGDEPIFLEIHGGGLTMGGGDLAWMMAATHARDRRGVTWVPDYRMPPDHPYPTPLDDVLAAYRAALALRPAGRIVVSGESGGANLAAALLLRARAEGLPMPAALVLLTPQVDLTESGDSFRTNLGMDIMGTLMKQNLLYADGTDLSDPHLSPLFGDLSGFPSTFVQSGTRDMFLSNAVRMHRALRRAQVEAELHVFEAMPHGSFGGSAPEDLELRAEVRRFEARHLARPSS